MKVRVPASIANLGPGFDVLAMAVDIWLEADAEPSDKPRWRFDGPKPEAGHPFEKVAMKGHVKSQIPIGVGLGSSAAARVAALRVSGVQDERRLVSEAAAAEGHPDNVAAAVHGGVVACAGGEVVQLPVPDLEIALFVSREPQPTEEAREVLDVAVPRADAVFNSGHVALLVHALDARDWSLLGRAMDDRLHQPARTQLYPWLPAAIEAARGAGAWGAALAGAGPSVFAFCRSGIAGDVAERMTAAAGVPGEPRVTRIATWK